MAPGLLVLALAAASLVPTPVRAAPTRCQGQTVTISGSPRSDRISGTPGPDVIHAGDGDDLVRGGGGADVICGAGGRDSLSGGGGNDRLAGGGGNDAVSGDGGTDVLRGDAGDDRLAGGKGRFDRLDYSASTNAVSVDLADGFGIGQGTDDVVTIEGVAGSAQDDTIAGDGGFNFILGGSGSDDLEGAGGFDVVLYMTSTQAVDVDLSTGVASSDANDALANFEGVVGSDFNDTVTGNDGRNLLFGRGGRDTITGAAGNDYIAAGTGADSIDGGADLDIADFDERAVTVDLGAGTAVGEGADTVAGIEGVRGSPFDDTITGDAVANTLFGRGGNDVLSGAEGDDRLHGGDGDDAAEGGDGTDLCSAESAQTCENDSTSEPSHELETKADDTKTYLKRAH